MVLTKYGNSLLIIICVFECYFAFFRHCCLNRLQSTLYFDFSEKKCTISKLGRDLYVSGFVCDLNSEGDVRTSSRNALAELNG